VEARYQVAYNQTRGCILGVEIACGDLSAASLAERLPKLTPKSGTGLWLLPFRGIPVADVRVPLDLIYLDEDCRVIEAVELFPTYRVSPSSPPAASVLALPTHTIFSSHTQAGDQVVFGLAEEIESDLARIFASSGGGSGAQEMAAHSLQEFHHDEDRPDVKNTAPQPEEVPVETPPWKPKASKPKSWLQRWLSPEPEDPRKATREALPGLAAYFFTGGTPKPHAILNISSTGLYVLTEERWYPGTIIQMTLKKASNEGTRIESSISLLAKANRWGNDGVGLSFVVRGPQTEGVEREVLDQFLDQIGWGKR
jgi:hypothetical protein